MLEKEQCPDLPSSISKALTKCGSTRLLELVQVFFISSPSRTLEEDKVGLASFHLEEDAQLGFPKLEHDKPKFVVDLKSYCKLQFLTASLKSLFAKSGNFRGL